MVPPAVARMIRKRPVLQQDYTAQDHASDQRRKVLIMRSSKDNGVIPTASTCQSVRHYIARLK